MAKPCGRAIPINVASCAKWSRSPECSKGFDAWITGIRREQSPTRANAKLIEWDQKFQLVKVNPLVEVDVGGCLDLHSVYEVPYNELHDRNYPEYRLHPLHEPGDARRRLRAPGGGKTLPKLSAGLHKAS